MQFAQTKMTDTLSPASQFGGAGERIVLIHATDYTGFRAYYFLLAHPLRFSQLQKIVKSGASFDLEPYGEILKSGYGTVPEHVKEDIRRRYGWKG